MDDSARRADAERLPIALHVRFGEADGVAVNLSPRGLCLRTNATLVEGQTLAMALFTTEGAAVGTVTGDVRWVVEMSPLLQPTFLHEAGLAIPDPEPGYLELFGRETASFVDYRNVPRFSHLLRVEVAGPGLWETTFALNLGRRGVFVRTDQSLEVGQLVDVRLFLPELEDAIRVRAEVVHVLDREHAAAVGADAGVGLRLGSLPSEVRERYQAYVDELEARFRT
jgi:Tfp pilus assembly protein PilZ